MHLKPKYLIPAIFLLSLGFSSCYIMAVQTAIKAANKEVDSVLVYLSRKDHPDFQSVEVPDKMETYSAVLLNRHILLKYELRNVGTFEYQGVRMRLKLQDKASLEEFSEFYYPVTARASFQVIKADGTKKTIDPEEAVEVEERGSTNSLFIWSGSLSSYNKMALPGLEIGDIIDFTFLQHDLDERKPSYWPEMNINLAGEYPAVKQLIDLTVGKEFYLNTASLNGAPKFKKVALRDDYDYNKKFKENANRYVMEDGERLPIKGQHWISKFKTHPIIRIQAAQKGSEASSGTYVPFFFQKHQMISEGVSRTKARTTISNYLDEMDLWPFYTCDKDIVKHIENELKARSQVDKARMAYYHLRSRLFTNIVNKDGIDYEIKPDLLSRKGLSWRRFYFAYKDYLEDLNVRYSVIAYVPRVFGSFDDILTFTDFTIAFVIQDRNEVYIARNPTFYSNFGKPHPTFENSDYEILSGRKVRIDFDEIASTYEDNRSEYKLEVALNQDQDAVEISRDAQLHGYSRLNHWHSVVSLGDYYESEMERLKLEFPEETTRNLKRKEMINSDREELFSKVRENQVEMHKDDLENNYDIELEEVESFELINDGRYDDNPVLHYKDVFSTNDFVQQVGNNIILNIGSLIGGQIELEEDDMERETDAYLAYPRTLDYSITFTLPDGYTAEGLDAFNFNVDHDAGGFVSEATLQGNKLEVHAKKMYRRFTVPAADWSQMVDFLEAAYDFTQKKVVLKQVAG